MDSFPPWMPMKELTSSKSFFIFTFFPKHPRQLLVSLENLAATSQKEVCRILHIGYPPPPSYPPFPQSHHSNRLLLPSHILKRVPQPSFHQNTETQSNSNTKNHKGTNTPTTTKSKLPLQAKIHPPFSREKTQATPTPKTAWNNNKSSSNNNNNKTTTKIQTTSTKKH